MKITQMRQGYRPRGTGAAPRSWQVPTETCMAVEPRSDRSVTLTPVGITTTMEAVLASIDWEAANGIRSRVLAAALIPARIVKVVIAAHEMPSRPRARAWPSRARLGRVKPACYGTVTTLLVTCWNTLWLMLAVTCPPVPSHTPLVLLRIRL